MGSTTTIVAAWLIAASALGQTLSEQRIEEQNQKFHRWWQTDLVWNFDELPTQGSVPDYRIPYSGYIYPDAAGGTANVMRRYDMAFHRGDLRATRWEHWDIAAYQRTQYHTQRIGLFRSTQVAVRTTPHWHGHCNGWAAAAIRHAEPQRSVVRNGVTFTPADIKGLLAELYIYQETDNISGEYGLVHPAELHIALANWLGRFSHPLAMDADPGEEKWNYPIYSFASSYARRGPRQVDVRTRIRYAVNSRGEFQQSPRIARERHFAYRLDLNEDGDIIGGAFYRGSSRIALLWLPVYPQRGGTPGNERGNPHLDVDEVLAIWRDSVPEEHVSRWVNIDDRSTRESEIASVTDDVPDTASVTTDEAQAEEAVPDESLQGVDEPEVGEEFADPALQPAA